MSIQHFGKGALRVAKNYTKGYSDVQAKVRDATSNDPWGPSGTQMNEIAQMTYNQNDFVEIMEMLDKRLNDKGKNWRHVFKSLTLLDYCLHAGSENVVIYFRDNIYIIKTLKEFQYMDEYGKDQGANVRQKAKDITNLLSDESRLREERRSRAHMRDRMTTGRDGFPDGEVDDMGFRDENRQRRQIPPRQPPGDDELNRAIEESKRTAAAERNKNGHMTAEERDIAEALRLSKEEEEKQARLAQDSTEAALFDDSNQALPANGYPLIDASLQPQFQLQSQMTAMQPQFTAFNPYQQQAQQEAMQQQWVQQQTEWMRQQQELQAQQQAQQLQQQQQTEWMRQQQELQAQQQAQQQAQLLQQQQQQFLQQQQQQQQQMQLQPSPMQPQPTGFGSNNPFAPSTTPSVFSSNGLSPSPQPSQPSSFNNFNLPGTFDNRSSSSASSYRTTSPPVRGPTKADEQHAHLANLIGNAEDGVDTFGNFGQLRYGGNVPFGAQKTGANPFQAQQQHSSDQPFFSV